MSAKNNMPRAASDRPQGEITARSEQSGRRTYHPPVLSRYGDVRGLTLGGSPGFGDSGSGGGQENPFQGGP